MRTDTPGPYSISSLAKTSLPLLFTTGPDIWRSRLIAWFEDATGRKLYPAQVETLLIETLAYAMGVLGEEGQSVVRQHLVATADGAALERLGANRSTPRLQAASARTTMRVSLDAPAAQSVLIPAGTLVGSGNSVTFATLAAVAIAPGASGVDVAAQAREAGPQANAFAPGQITGWVGASIAGASVSNITTSEGGADIEDLDLYRLRVANAFDRISTQGSRAWYREETLKVSPSIIDVAVVRPQPCYVDIYPLTREGAAGPDLRAQIQAAFNTASALDIRFGDDVTVKPPVPVMLLPDLTVWVQGSAPTIAADARAAANAVLAGWGQKLGSIVSSHDVEAAVKKLPGVLDARVANFDFRVLAASEFLAATEVTVSVVPVP